MTYPTSNPPTQRPLDGKPVESVYEACRIKRKRRTNSQIADLDQSIATILEGIRPATLRQLFYQLVTAGVIEKTEAEYDTTGRRLGKMRRDGRIPFSWVTDSTRWMRKPQSYTSIENAILETARCYRRNLWYDQPVACEIWCEKDTLTGTLYDVTAEFDVPLMVVKGFSSLTFLHSAAEDIADAGKPTHIYYLGDYDPSGISIAATVESTLREFAGGAEIHFDRIAVTEAQIVAYKLPTRPTKKSDSRSKNFKGESVEVDAIEPDVLRGLVRDRIEQHVDAESLRVLKTAEQSERAWLKNLANAGVQ